VARGETAGDIEQIGGILMGGRARRENRVIAGMLPLLALAGCRQPG